MNLSTLGLEVSTGTRVLHQHRRHEPDLTGESGSLYPCLPIRQDPAELLALECVHHIAVLDGSGGHLLVSITRTGGTLEKPVRPFRPASLVALSSGGEAVTGTMT